MDTYTSKKQLADLFRQTVRAHHQAYIETDGADPEWPLWYADYLHEKLANLLNKSITKSELVYLLVLVDKEYRSKAPETKWPEYYADFFLDQLGLAPEN